MVQPLESEIGQGKERFAAIAKLAYDLVWNGFPEDIRPDVTQLPNPSNIEIGPIPADPSIRFHPLIREEIRKPAEKILARISKLESEEKVSWFNGNTHTFIPMLLTDEQLMKHVVFYQVGTVVNMNMPPLFPDAYDLPMRNLVEQKIEEGFVKGSGITISQTHIERHGFRKLLKVGEFAVTDLIRSRYLFAMNEMFNLGFEFVTSEILRQGGDTNRFERAIQSGRLSPDLFTSDPLYYARFFELAREVDWRVVLKALHMGDIHESLKQLEPTFGQRAAEKLNQLLSSLTDTNGSSSPIQAYLADLGL